MKIIKTIIEAEVIGAFLQAELDSSRFRIGSQKALQMLSLPTSLITDPDYTNTTQNNQRAKVLELTRGWPNQWLFTNFPTDVHWFLVNLSQTELDQSYRLKGRPDFLKTDRQLANIIGKMRLVEVVENVDPILIQQISLSIESGEIIPPIILVTTDLEADQVLLEGHSRSLAYCLANPDLLKTGITAILGVSKQLPKWEYY